MLDIKTVGILSKPGIAHASGLISELLDWLARHGISARYDAETAAYLGRTDGTPRDEVPDGTQLIIVLGGDGTLLSAARAVRGREIPLFAVNLADWDSHRHHHRPNIPRTGAGAAWRAAHCSPAHVELRTGSRRNAGGGV